MGALMTGRVPVFTSGAIELLGQYGVNDHTAVRQLGYNAIVSRKEDMDRLRHEREGIVA